MPSDNLSLKPQPCIDYKGRKKDDSWYYEDSRGVAVYIKGDDGNVYSTMISWRRLRSSLARKDGVNAD